MLVFSHVKTEQARKSQAFKNNVKTDKYAEKGWNSRFIVVLITSLKKRVDKELTLLKRNYRIKQYLRLNKIHRLRYCHIVMQMVANRNLKQHRKTGF